MSLAILFHFLCVQRISDINISIIRSLRLFCWITTLVVLFLVRCVLEFWCGWVGVVSVWQAEACHTVTTPTQPHRNSNTHRNKNTQTMWWYNIKVAGSWWWMCTGGGGVGAYVGTGAYLPMMAVLWIGMHRNTNSTSAVDSSLPQHIYFGSVEK